MVERSYRVGFVGDLSLGDHPVCVGHGMRSAFKKEGSGILGKVSSIFEEFDLTVGNLETVCSDKGLRPNELSSYEMRGSPESLQYLKQAGIDVLGIANNHAMQHGGAAFWDTIDHVKDQGMQVIGLDNEDGKTEEYWFKGDSNCENVLVGFSIRPEEWTTDNPPYSLRLDHKRLLDEIEELRSRCEGYLICSIHWGLEFLHKVDPEIRNLARMMVECGADVIVGHHPHVIQPFEHYGSGVIIYSIGNFTFDLWPASTRHSVIAELILSQGKRPEVVFHPVWINGDFSVSKASSDVAKYTHDVLNNSLLLDHPLSVDQYKAEYRSARKRFRYSSYVYFLRNIFKYPAEFLYQSVFRTLRRRLSGE